MRKLFVPACVCLMTLSGSTGNDPKISLEQFVSARKLEQMVAASRTAEVEEARPPVNDVAEVRQPMSADEAAAEAIDTPVAIPPRTEAASMQNDGATAPIEAAPLPKPKPEIKPVIYRPRDEVCDILTRAAQHNGLPVPFFIRLLFQESGFSPGVVSNAGAQGIAQFMPNTATEWGVDNPFDPLEAIPASARLLRNLFEKFGNLGLAAAAYNAGPKRIQDWLAKKGPLPQETQGYVKNITGRPAENWKASENGAPAVKLPRHAPCQEAAGLLAWNGPDEIPTPVTAPHRRPKEPELVVAAAPAKSGEAKSDKREVKATTKNDVRMARQGGRVTAVIKVADASGSLPKAKSKDEPKTAAKKESDKKQLARADDIKKTVAKTKDGKKDGKGALQLAARKQNKDKQTKKLRVSQR